MQFGLGLGGVLVGNPIKAEDALDAGVIDENIGKAIADADRQGISRKALTPYLLRRIFELTGGKSLISNIALVENNARVAAAIAVALAARGK
jgi:pseudouridine-5'-phosphate glycosidase